LVEREIAVETGVLYQPREFFRLLRLTREQLMNTTLFVTVDIAVDTLLPDEVDVNITVRERWYLFPVPYFRIIDRNINVWINEHKASLDRADIGLKIIHNNLTGRNDKMNLYLIGGYSQQIVANYYQPYVDKKLRQGVGGGFSLMRAREVNYLTDSNRQVFFSLPEFARKTLKADLTYSYRKGSQMRSFFRVSYTKEEMDSAIIALNPNIFGNGRSQAEFVDLYATYQYLNVDYIPYPLRGWMVDLYALQRISSSIPMFQVGGKMQATWRFLPKTYMNFQGSFAVSFSESQPYYNSRMLGYRSLYMQGLEYYVADGTLAGMLRATLRREVLAFTLHNLVRWKSHSEIPFKFFLKTYGNVGYAYQKEAGNNFMNNKLLRTAGFGLDIQTVYDMVLKLEYSYNQFGERGFYIHTATDF
ncbi:MAG TPA: hypothetical protein VK907_12675, partial [Phnomibacter sp.]|nr:hypothetical protein [Phnomibacter sp.]